MLDLILPLLVLLVVVLGILLIFYLIKSDGNVIEIYDERQTLETLKAYKYGFFTMLIAILICIFASEFAPDLLDTLDVCIFILLSGFVVFITVQVLHDAYFPVNKNPKRYLILNGLIALVNFLGFVMSYIDHESDKIYYINRVVSALFAYLFVLIIIKTLKDKSEE